jgi:hypothetical protein
MSSNRDEWIKRGVELGLGYEELQILPLPKLRDRVSKLQPKEPKEPKETKEPKRQPKVKVPLLKLPTEVAPSVVEQPIPKKEMTVLQGDELLMRYKEILSLVDSIIVSENTNQELIKEFASLWHEADKQAFEVECTHLSSQKVELAKEALEIQRQWGDSLVDRKHAYMMIMENFSNTSGKMTDYIRTQLAELESVLVRFEEDKRQFQEMTSSSSFPLYELAVNSPQKLYDTERHSHGLSQGHSQIHSQGHSQRALSVNNHSITPSQELHIE